jgi:hypothetical protein
MGGYIEQPLLYLLYRRSLPSGSTILSTLLGGNISRAVHQHSMAMGGIAGGHSILSFSRVVAIRRLRGHQQHRVAAGGENGRGGVEGL